MDKKSINLQIFNRRPGSDSFLLPLLLPASVNCRLHRVEVWTAVGSLEDEPSTEETLALPWLLSDGRRVNRLPQSQVAATT